MALKKKSEPVEFSAILRGIQQAVTGAQEILQAQQVDNIRSFFTPEGKPVSQKIRFGNEEAEVPLMAIVPHRTVSMDEVEIKFKTKVGSVSTDRMPNSVSSAGDTVSSANLQMQMDGISPADGDVMEVTIRFKAQEAPEGLARIMDEYNKHIGH